MLSPATNFPNFKAYQFESDPSRGVFYVGNGTHIMNKSVGIDYNARTGLMVGLYVKSNNLSFYERVNHTAFKIVGERYLFVVCSTCYNGTVELYDTQPPLMVEVNVTNTTGNDSLSAKKTRKLQPSSNTTTNSST